MALFCGDDRDIEFFCPAAQLFDGSSTKGIACTQDHALALLLVVIGQLGDRRCFSCPIDTDDHLDKRPGATLLEVSFVLKDRDQRVESLDAAYLLGKTLEQTLHKIIIDISFQKNILKLFSTDFSLFFRYDLLDRFACFPECFF